jgi:hypothetical protein
MTNFATDDLSSLTTSQFNYLTSTQIGALSAEQSGSLSAAQRRSVGLVSPLVLDLNGDGIQTLSITDGVRFDLNANGTIDNVGWASSQDGLLAVDLNSDGQINSGAELFGEFSLKSDGEKAADGFDALASYDSNHDGIINGEDKIFDRLTVWQDSNSDGLTDSGELKSLNELGIRSIDLAAVSVFEISNGNEIKLTSTYDSNGGVKSISDVWFRTSEAELASSAANIAELIQSNVTGKTVANASQPVSDSSNDQLLAGNAIALASLIEKYGTGLGSGSTVANSGVGLQSIFEGRNNSIDKLEFKGIFTNK